ncbi:hypothetical protein HMPREF0742_02310 [Rothia aeria F0184]|uniref:Uncharacterized protein n=1 Tax=Rothia aeria F0184 TaxID=888019 RepID=U7UZN8_9MICC|nr:hypothetical protein HMPREF0742_02310 [Rothia aeria F0184]
MLLIADSRIYISFCHLVLKVNQLSWIGQWGVHFLPLFPAI